MSIADDFRTAMVELDAERLRNRKAWSMVFRYGQGPVRVQAVEYLARTASPEILASTLRIYAKLEDAQEVGDTQAVMNFQDDILNLLLEPDITITVKL